MSSIFVFHEQERHQNLLFPLRRKIFPVLYPHSNASGAFTPASRFILAVDLISSFPPRCICQSNTPLSHLFRLNSCGGRCMTDEVEPSAFTPPLTREPQAVHQHYLTCCLASPIVFVFLCSVAKLGTLYSTSFRLHFALAYRLLAALCVCWRH